MKIISQYPDALFNLDELKKKYSLSTEQFSECLAKAKKAMQPYSKIVNINISDCALAYNVTRHGFGTLITDFGVFFMYVFKINDMWNTYNVLIKAPSIDEQFIPQFKNPSCITVRLDSECLTGQLLGDKTCDCKEQLFFAMKIISQIGEGIIISIPEQDGRGMGIAFKLATLMLQKELDVNTVEAANILADSSLIDTRTYDGAVCILKFLGIDQKSKINLATNNSAKKKALLDNGYTVESTVPIVIEPNEYTSRHLQAKKKYLGHTI